MHTSRLKLLRLFCGKKRLFVGDLRFLKCFVGPPRSAVALRFAAGDFEIGTRMGNGSLRVAPPTTRC